MNSVLVEYRGDCMGSMIESGSVMTALPGAEVYPLDLVSVVLDSLSGPWARFVNSLSGEGYAGLVKIFLGVYEVDGEQVGLFGQLNPPTIVPIPKSAIAAMYKIDFSHQCQGEDQEALALFAPFVGIGMSKQ